MRLFYHLIQVELPDQKTTDKGGYVKFIFI